MRILVLLFLTLVFGAGIALADKGTDTQRIQPFAANPWYWQYKGKPVMLLGGSVEDNLFQISNLKEHLDQLASSGGNYVRNTMSSRDDGYVWPFLKIQDGKYDLEKMDADYWKRFENLLKLALERDIIVQIEVWDRFETAREPWEASPYNPANNINYAQEQTGLAHRYPNHPGSNENPFFRSPPTLQNIPTLIEYQTAQVDKMLSISLKYPNVLYCIDNETSASPLWSEHWARYILKKARQCGVTVYVTKMWDAWNLGHPSNKATFDHLELYAFVDISQNNHQKGQTHRDNAMKAREYLASKPRPINMVKVYGNDASTYGSTRDGLERFWRSTLGGMAAIRFHRPSAGLGFGAEAEANIRSARMLFDLLDFTQMSPEDGLLEERKDNEASCLARRGFQYAVFCTNGGAVEIDTGVDSFQGSLRWLDFRQSRWHEDAVTVNGRKLKLRALGKGLWVALAEREKP